MNAGRSSTGPDLASLGHTRLLTFYGCSILVGSASIFMVQPYVGRLLTPRFGCAANVWLVAMLFFQVTLLSGYWLADALRKVRNHCLQKKIYLALLLAGLTSTWVFDPAQSEAPNGTWFWILLYLLKFIALPFVALSMASPLIQYWYGRSTRSSVNPYVLYAASNLGSLLGLLLYPFVLERLVPLAWHRWVWIGGIVTLVVGLAAAMLWERSRAAVERDPLVSMRRSVPATQGEAGVHHASLANPTRWWVVLAFVPSSLMLGLTAHASSDIASIPVIWVLPLTMYLLSMMIAFTGLLQVRRVHLFVGAFIIFVLLFAHGLVNSAALLAGHCLGFLLIATIFHTLLYDARPPAAQLTVFYRWVSIGGALGGLFNGVIAPLLFPSTIEYQVVLVLSILVWLLHPTLGRGKQSEFRFGVPVVALCLLGVTIEVLQGDDVATFIPWLVAAAGLVCVSLLAYSPLIASRVAIVLLVSVALQNHVGYKDVTVLAQARSFYGTYQVKERPSGLRYLYSGTTVHGLQAREDPARALSYYAEAGPLGDVFDGMTQTRTPKVLVAGLGTGTIAAYAERTESIAFIDIDPLVIKLAREHFTYLSDCGEHCSVAIGDARQQIPHFSDVDLLVLDTFASDSIPVHVITREALLSYRAALTRGAIIACNISSRYLDLAPAFSAAARDLGLHTRIKLHRPDRGAPGVSASKWVVLTADETAVRFLDGRGWSDIEPGTATAWTDDFADVLSAYRF